MEKILQHIYTMGELISKCILKIAALNTINTDNQRKILFLLGRILNP